MYDVGATLNRTVMSAGAVMLESLQEMDVVQDPVEFGAENKRNVTGQDKAEKPF